MENLGIASPKVELLAKLPNVGEFVNVSNFESSAHGWDGLQNSPFFSPLLAESVIDPAGTLAAIMPSKRIFWLNNYLSDSGAEVSSDFPSIEWTPTVTGLSPCIMNDIIEEGEYLEYELPSSFVGLPDDYDGPYWSNAYLSRQTDPNDALTIKEFLSWVGEPETSEPPPTDTDPEFVNNAAIAQDQVKAGMWWSVESNAFLEENMPFWLILDKMEPPTSSKHETLFVISLGLSDEEHRFDILFSMNNKPRVIDWLGFTAGGDESRPPIQKEFEQEDSRIWNNDKLNKIGIMTIAGRLVVVVNGNVMVYTRINKNEDDNGGKLLECKIAEGAIRLWGTNVKAVLNVSLMTFAEVAAVAIPVPVIVMDGEDSGAPPYFEGIDQNGDPNGSVCELPTPEGEQLYGCDCNTFEDATGSTSPSGFGFHKHGEIKFTKADSVTFASLPSTEFYTLLMKPEDTEMGGFTIENGGAPFYFRLKGMYETDLPDPDAGENENITDNVISINETATSPDYFHCKKSVDITCYDEGAVISGVLSSGQSGVKVSWGWDGSSVHTFTGVVINFSTSKKAGLETVTMRAEDYMFILNKTPIMNSPYYDGMVAYYALEDMAKRASISGFTNDWESTSDYFLPAGYSFSKPMMRYDSQQSIFDCMMDIVKRFEAFIYFDEDGRLVVTRLPGGLFSDSFSTVADFVIDPDESDISKIILEEIQVETDFSSTVNVISAMTLERDTRNAVIYVKSADGSENNLLFKKVLLLRQAALGELEVCRNYVEDLSARVFYPILKTRWKTAGFVDITPLSFVRVEGQPFRVMSVKRSFNADQNDLTSSYEGEWLGGA